MTDVPPESNWRQATKEHRDLVITTRQLIDEYLRLYGSVPSTEWLFKQIGLAP